MNEMELLAPAGDLKILKSAINAGADAVYFGGDMFGARASAKNFSFEDAKEGLSYIHNRNKKAYLTVNTLLKNLEIENQLYDYIKAYYEEGIDGVIIQDYGVFCFLREFFPELELHASTQMNISSKYGAHFLKDSGAKRIVPGRELSLDEIKTIHDEVGIEIEVFVHGALCVCYSGNCLMSSFIGGRSGNRGRCAQPCRLPYYLCDENKNLIDSEQKYYISPKDLWGIHDLPRLYNAGVYSLKVEGRLKNEAYVTNVVSVYRKYLDRLFTEGEKNYFVEKKDELRLLDAGNRGGFTNRYYDVHNDVNMMDYEKSSFTQKNKNSYIGSSEAKKISLYGELFVEIGSPIRLNVWDENGKTVELEEGNVEEATGHPTSVEDISSKLSTSGDSAYCISDISYHMDDNAFVPMKFIKALRRNALAYFENQSIKKVKDYTQVNKLPSEKSDAVIVGVSTIPQLQELKNFDFISTIVLKDNLWMTQVELVKDVLKDNRAVYLSLPVVIRKNILDDLIKKLKVVINEISGIYVSSYDGLGLLNNLGYPKEKVFFDQRMYTYSNRSEEAFYGAGYENFYVPLELNEKELLHRYNASSELLVYGYVPLMYMANCVFKSKFPCQSVREALTYLKDRKDAYFPVVNQCHTCTNVLYNSLPVCLFDQPGSVKRLNAKRIRLDFSVESNEETKNVLEAFYHCFILEENKNLNFDVTRGHFKRGVL